MTALVAFLRPVSTLERVFGNGKQLHQATLTVYGSRRGEPGGGHPEAPACDELNETF